ncbi:MAG: hypothetical protein ACI8ZN_000846, partial [Bacteroidia bacterium]
SLKPGISDGDYGLIFNIRSLSTQSSPSDYG